LLIQERIAMASRSHRAPVNLTRRSLLAAAAGTAGIGVLGGGISVAQAAGAPLAPLAKVPLLPAGAPVRSQFGPDEQVYAGFLAICAPMANDMNDSDTADRGFLGGGWWRDPNNASNARVQEHVATLSWFYANDKPWNPYYKNAALLARTDAAIAHYLALQHIEGDQASWPEYSAAEHSLSATAFGVGYLAKTFRNLKRADALPSRRAEIDTSMKRGMRWLLDTSRGFWGNGGQTAWANQICAGLAGCATGLWQSPDAGLSGKLNERLSFFAQHGQSAAGFFYEFDGMDVGYNFEVMMPELAEVYIRTQHPSAAQLAQRWADWYGYVALREPDGAGMVNYTAASSRTEIRYHDNVVSEPDKAGFGANLAKVAPKLAAFYTAREDRAAARASWAAASGPAPALAKGGPTEPREMAQRFMGDYWPTRAEKDAAIAQLPYLSSTEWAEVRRDDQVPVSKKQQYLFVRRPKYYFGAFFGTRPVVVSGGISSGPGFLWHPAAGIVVHGGRGDATTCWATIASSGADALTSLDASYQIAGAGWGGGRTNPGASAVVVSQSRSDGSVPTTLTLSRDAVIRAVKAGGAATEQIPLVLLPSDAVSFANGVTAPYNQNTTATTNGLTIRRGATTITITWSQQATATLSTTGTTYFRDARRRLHLLRIPHGGSLTTAITF
jgi:hypothetical protein